MLIQGEFFVQGDLMWMGSVGQELHYLEKERAIQTDPEETRRRRTIKLVRKDPENGSWGFALQVVFNYQSVICFLSWLW